MADRVEGFCLDVVKIEPGVYVLVYLPHHGDVIPPDYVKAKNNLFDARGGGKDPLVCVVQDDVDGLVETLQSSDEVPSVRRDDGDEPVDITLQRSHFF